MSDSANLATAVAGVDLYQHVAETGLTSLIALVLALAVFRQLGCPSRFDASAKLVAIEHAFHMRLVPFLPRVLVVALTLIKARHSRRLFLAALAGGCLAVAVAPERVVAFFRSSGALVVSLASAVLASNIPPRINIPPLYCQDACSRWLPNAGSQRSFCRG